MHRLRPFWRPETGIFLALWLLLLLGGRSRLFGDPGTFWHTELGKCFLESGEFVHRDPFSFTAGDQPYVSYQWLGDCVMALVDRLAGLDSLLLFTATILAALFAWLAQRLIHAGLHGLLAFLVVALALTASAANLHI